MIWLAETHWVWKRFYFACAYNLFTKQKNIVMRIKHYTDCTHKHIKTSARHGQMCGGQILFHQVKTLAKENNLKWWLIEEFIVLWKNPNHFNVNDEWRLLAQWEPEFRKFIRGKAWTLSFFHTKRGIGKGRNRSLQYSVLNHKCDNYLKKWALMKGKIFGILREKIKLYW